MGWDAAYLTVEQGTYCVEPPVIDLRFLVLRHVVHPSAAVRVARVLPLRPDAFLE